MNSFEKNDIKTKSKKKIIIFFLIFLVVLLTVILGVYSYFSSTSSSDAVKKELFSKIKNTDIAFFTKNELYDEIAEKINIKNYSSNSNFKISTTMENNMFSKLDLYKFNFSYNIMKNNKDNISLNSINAKYSENDLLNLDYILAENEFAIKSDEIVNKYVGFENKNFHDIINKVYGKNVDLTTSKKIKNFLFDRQWINPEYIYTDIKNNQYYDVFKKDSSNANFSKKENLILEADSQQISVIEYTVEVNNQEFDGLISDIKNVLENDENLFSGLVVNNVENFEDDSSLELENNQLNEVSAETNNYEATIQLEIDENDLSNTAVQNTTNSVVENTVTVNNTTTENTTVQNTTNSTNTVNNEINNTNTNMNTVNNNVENQVVSSNTSEENTVNIIEQVHEEPVLEQPETIPQNNTQNTIINEEENLRTQGYISINDEEDEMMSIDEDEEFILGDNFEETLQNINEFSEKIDWYTYLITFAKANILQEDLLNEFKNIIDDIKRQNCSLILKFYINQENNNLEKLSLEIPELNKKIEFQIISKTDSEKYLNMTYIKGTGDLAHGNKISIYKKLDSSSVKIKILSNKIDKNKITKKYSIEIKTNKLNNSNKYNTNLDFNYSDNSGKFEINSENTLDFENFNEWDRLNEENCLYLDRLSDEDMLANINAIKEKTISVLREKNKKLNIIDINNSSSIVEQREENNQNIDNKEKDEVKNLLITTISNLMGECEQEGNKLTLPDLEGLQIQDHDVNVSISSNLAIITVDGYVFKLDSEFNLSDS